MVICAHGGTAAAAGHDALAQRVQEFAHVGVDSGRSHRAQVFWLATGRAHKWASVLRMD